MEAAEKSKRTTSDARLSALQTRNKKATCFITFFFLSLFLVMAALITYIVLDINSKSMVNTAALNSSPTLTTQNPNNTTLAVFLQTAADQLLNATSFLESTPGLKNCIDRVCRALVMIQYAIKETNDPITKWRIETAEWSLNQCLEDLKKRELTSTAPVRTKVLEVQESVKKCKEYYRSDEKNDWMGEVLKVEKMFLLVLGVLVLGFIGFVFLVVCCSLLIYYVV